MEPAPLEGLMHLRGQLRMQLAIYSQDLTGGFKDAVWFHRRQADGRGAGGI